MAESRRPPGSELLDDPEADPAAVRESLRYIARSNRWFGGWWALRFGLSRILQGLPQDIEVTLLDVGTGMGDLPLLAEHWAMRHRIAILPIGLERHRAAARLAADAGIPTMLGDATTLPVRTRSVDIVLLSQVLHHFPRDAAIRLLAEAERVAQLGVIVADLQRSPLALAGFWVGARFLGFDAATRSDGLTSVRRGYTQTELEDLLRAAGIRVPVSERPGFRLVAAWRAGGGR